MTHPVDTSQPLSPANPAIVHGLMNKVATMVGMQVMHGFSNMDLHSPRPTWLLPLLSAKSASSRDQHWVPSRTLFPEVISQLPGDRLIRLDCFYHGRGSTWFLLNRYLVCIQICLPCTKCFCQNYYPWTYRNAFSIPTIVLQSTAADQGTHFTAKKKKKSVAMG